MSKTVLFYPVVFILCVSSCLAIAREDAFPSNGLSEYLLQELYDEVEAELASETSAPSDLFKGGWYSTPPTIGNPFLPPVIDSSPKWVDTRCPEEEEEKAMSSGYQFVSGGAGEGQQNLKPEGTVESKQEIKTDADLPSYCSPPNPCPKGKTAADGCQESIPDTAEFNRNYIRREMAEGYCECDYEHMSKDVCPQIGGEDGLSEEIDDLLDSILEMELGNKDEERLNPYITDGEKRNSLTAKKGGQHVLAKRNAAESHMKKENPYLVGDRLPVVAKKSPQV